MSDFLPHVVTLDSSQLARPDVKKIPLLERYQSVLSHIDTYAADGFRDALAMWIEMQWLMLDKPYYRVAPKIAEAFLKTRLDRVILSELRLPYQAMEVRLPDLPDLRLDGDRLRVSSVLLSLAIGEIAPARHHVHHREPYLGLLSNVRNRQTGRVEHEYRILNRLPSFKTLDDAVSFFPGDEHLPTQEMAKQLAIP